LDERRLEERLDFLDPAALDALRLRRFPPICERLDERRLEERRRDFTGAALEALDGRERREERLDALDAFRRLAPPSWVMMERVPITKFCSESLS
jgi:hypothetical protein